MAPAFFTIGHSTRSVPELAGLLRQAGAEAVVDVRAFPRSRSNPQFNVDVLPAALAEWQIGYRHIQALGGLRGRKDPGGKDPGGKAPGLRPNTYWRNQSFRNYADYTATEAFRDGLAELRALGHGRACAVMCAEAVWWRCHRRIIADYLLSQGEQVFHIMAAGKVEPASFNPAAIRKPDGTLIYSGDGADERSG